MRLSFSYKALGVTLWVLLLVLLLFTNDLNFSKSSKEPSDKGNPKKGNHKPSIDFMNLPQNTLTLPISKQKPNLNKNQTQQLHQTLKVHKYFLEKCFIKHYSRQKGQTQSGKVWFFLTIKETGQISSLRVDESDYSDKTFHACLKEVLRRIRLKNYKGPSIELRLPLQMTLPLSK